MANKILILSEKIILYLTYLLVFLTPLILLPEVLPEASKLGLVYFISSTVFFCWLIKTIVLRKLILRWNFIAFFIILFIFGILLTLPFSSDVNTSFFGPYSRFHGGLLSYLSYSTVFFVVLNNFNNDQTKKTIIVAIAGAIIVSLFGVVQYFVLGIPRVYATLQHPGFYASYLSITFFLSIGMLIEARSNLAKVLFLISGAVLYLGFTFSYTRGAMLGLMSGVLVFVLFLGLAITKDKNLVDKILKPNLKFITALSMLILVTNIVFSNPLVNRPIITPVISKEEPESDYTITSTGKNRLIVWKGAFNTFKSYPFFGSGLETFRTSFQRFRPVELNYTNEWYKHFDKAHNEYLHFFATTGLIGGISYLLLIGSAFLFTFKLIKKKKNNLLTTAIIGSLTSYFVHNFFLFSVTTTALMFYILVAFLVIFSKDYNEIVINLKFLSSKKNKVFAYIIAIFFFAVSISYSSIFLVSEIFVGQSVSAFLQLKPERSHNFMKQASSINKFQPAYNVKSSYTAYVYAALTDNKSQTEKLAKEIYLLNTKAINSSPNNIYILTLARDSYSNIALFSNNSRLYFEKAVEVQVKIVEMSPTSALEHYKLAKLHFRLNNLASAELIVKKALNLKSDYKDAKTLLATIYKDRDNVKEFDKIKETR